MNRSKHYWDEAQKLKALRLHTSEALECLRQAYSDELIKPHFGLYLRFYRRQTKILWARAGIVQGVLWTCPNAEFTPIISAMLSALKTWRTAEKKAAAAA